MDVTLEVDIAAPAEAVAAALLDFGGWARWNSAIEQMRVEGSGPGAVREYLAGGAPVRERLEEIADDGRGLSYTVLAGPLPVAEIRVTYRILETETQGSSRVRWLASFAAPEPLAEAFAEAAGGMEEATMELLKASLEI